MVLDVDKAISSDTLNICHFCRYCKYLHSPVGKLTCNAFPEGIPKKIIHGQHFHNKPMFGQKNDIVFKPGDVGR